MLVSHRTTLQTEFVMENEGKWRKQKVLVLKDVCPLRWIESSPEEEEEDGGVLIMELNMAQCTQSPEHQTCPGQQGGEGILPLCSPCETPAAAAPSCAAPARTTGHAPKLSLAPWFRLFALIMFWRELKLQELQTDFAIPLLSNFSVC